jgi:tRNA (guanine-N7-)-methyltransferase
MSGAKEATLEIGYGSGEHLVEYAKKRPEELFIGTEVFENGNAAMVRHLMDAGIKNVRIFPNDANLLFPHLPSGAFDQIFILYPDPWPKSRHEERRMISPERLAIFARLLKPGGRMLVASDHPVYIPHTLRVVGDSGLFTWAPSSFVRPPADWETTRYEQKAIKEGRIPIYLEFAKK